MQTFSRQLFFLSSSPHKVILDNYHLPARFPLQNLSFTGIIKPLHPSRCFRTQTRGAHNLSNRYKYLELEPLLAIEEEPLSSEPSQKPFLDTGVSALQMERITIKGKSILRPKPILFHGIPIPPKPPPPASDGMFLFKVVYLFLSGHTTPRIGGLIFD
jgi:hypothetical protein